MVDLETAERLAAESAVAVATERDVLRITGRDAVSYLQGQLSQDVEGLAVGATTRTLLLQPQGKIDAWMRMHRRSPDEVLLDVEPGFGAGAKERLERFKLRVDADIELRTVPTLAVRGPESRRVAGEVVDAVEGLLSLDAAWPGIDGVDLLDPTGETDPGSHLPDGLFVGPADVLELVRIRHGLPAMGRELDGSTIPAAAGIVDQSVDFTKGCYVGQELVARIDSRGSRTPTRLYGLRFAGSALPAVGDALLLDGAPAGTVTSVAVSPDSGAVGLGYLKRSVAVPATLAVGSSDRDLVAEATELPAPAS